VNAEPLTSEERDQFSPWGVYASSEEACAKAFARYEATVKAAEERAERSEERAEGFASLLHECLPALRSLSEQADLDGDQVLASVLHRTHGEISAALAADDAARGES